jgi:uncharacterized protein
MRKEGTVAQFFGLVLVLSLPFYALGITGYPLPFARSLPISAIMAMVPMVAAGLLVYRHGGLPATLHFVRQAVDAHRIPHAGWVIAALGIMPVAFALTAGILWLTGTTLPGLHLFPIITVTGSFAVFFIGAVGEELGWQAYAYPRLIRRYSALQAALIIGVIWALWHVIPFALMGRSTEWIVWQGAGMVCMRIIIVWLFVNTGQSIAVAVLFHMMSNAVWGMFTDFTPYYDPMNMCIVLLAAVIAVEVLWAATTLTLVRKA